MLISFLTVASVVLLIAGIMGFLNLHNHVDPILSGCSLVAGIVGALSLLWMAQVLDKLDKIHSSLNPNIEEDKQTTN